MLGGSGRRPLWGQRSRESVWRPTVLEADRCQPQPPPPEGVKGPLHEHRPNRERLHGASWRVNVLEQMAAIKRTVQHGAGVLAPAETRVRMCFWLTVSLKG